MIKKITFLNLLLSVVVLVTSFTVSAQTSRIFNFENSATIADWVLENNAPDVATASIVSLPAARTGNKVIKISDFSRNTGWHFKNQANPIIVPNTEYAHYISYVGSSADNVQASGGLSGDVAATPGMSSVTTRDASKRLTFKKQNTTGANATVYARLRTKPGTITNETYFDDVVIYSHSSGTTDLVAPNAPTGLVATNQSETSNKLDWTEGTDALTGVQETYIFRTSNTAAAAPSLMAQVAYHTTDIGEWKIVGVVAAGTTTFTDDFPLADGQPYKYAVAHRDLAYNNSTAATASATYPNIAVTGVTLNGDDEILIFPGNNKQLIATIAPLNAKNKNLIWTSSNPAVATVTDGLVETFAGVTGIVTIKVKTEDGNFSDTITVRVSTSATPPVPVSPIAIIIAIMLMAATIVYRANRKFRLQN